MRYIFTIIVFGFALIACGGGGSGSDSGVDSGGGTPSDPIEDDDAIINPKPEFEPYIYGEKLERNSGTWSMVIGDVSYSTNSTSQIGDLYFFDQGSHANGTFNSVAAFNDDVELMALVLQPNSGGEAIYGFGMNGNFNTSNNIGTAFYSGQYTSMDVNGNFQGVWDLEIFLDFDNISNSYAIDMDGGDTIQIHFVDYSVDSITGSISDLNHDYNLVSFGLFGQNSQTIAGGYANETGAGLLIGED